MMTGLKQFFISHPRLSDLVKRQIFSTLKPKLQKMQSDFSADVVEHGVAMQLHKAIEWSA